MVSRADSIFIEKFLIFWGFIGWLWLFMAFMAFYGF